jgi:hypothetical protein
MLPTLTLYVNAVPRGDTKVAELENVFTSIWEHVLLEI